jgi:hypothetical protein
MRSAHTGRFVARRGTTEGTPYASVESVTTPTRVAQPVAGRRPVSLPTNEINNAQRRQLVHQALVRAGVVSADPTPLTDAHPLPEAERSALAWQVGRGRPLSDYIREEREGR